MQEVQSALKKELHEMRGALATLFMLPRHVGETTIDVTKAEQVKHLMKSKLNDLRSIAERMHELVSQLENSNNK